MQNIPNNPQSHVEFIRSVPDFLDALAELIQTPYGWLPLIAIFAWFLLNKNVISIFRMLGDRERRTLEQIESYLVRDKGTDPKASLVFTDIITSKYFKSATGIYAEKKFRDILIELHESTSTKVGWVVIKRALPFIEVNADNKLMIRPPKKHEVIGRYYNNVVGWLLIAFSSSLFLISIASLREGILMFAAWLAATIFFMISSILVFSLNYPILAARKIERELSGPSAKVPKCKTLTYISRLSDK